MQQPVRQNSRAWAKQRPCEQYVARRPLHPASRFGCVWHTSNRFAAHSVAVETASAPVTQARGEQPPCLNFTDVNRHNFKAVLPIMRAAVQDATFVAIDAEFTGLFPEGVSDDALDDYEERYKKVLASADAFAICQFGLSAFKWQAAPAPGRGGYWEAKTFNAYIFPRPDDKTGIDKRFLCQASSLSYLAEKGFDFNKMIHDGIGFIPLQLREAKVRSLREDLENTQRSREVRSAQEEELVEAVRSRVMSWLLGTEQELVMSLPAQRRQRRLLQLVLQDEFQLPSLGYDPFSIEMSLPSDAAVGDSGVNGAGGAAAGGGNGGSPSLAEAEKGSVEEELSDVESDGREGEVGAAAAAGSLRLRRLDHWRPGNLIANGQHLTPRQRIEMLVEQSGFSQVLDIIRDSGRPLVGHNATLDLAYTLSQFNGTLPRNWRAYKALVQRCFPGGVYDTKHVATQLLAAGVPLGDSGLGSLYRTLTDEQWLRANVPGAGLPVAMGGGVPDIRHAPGFSGYVGASSTEKAHEAGFDAYMTGVAFARLLRLVAAKATLQSGGGAAAAAAADSIGVLTDAAAVADADPSSSSSSSSSDADVLLQPLGPYRGRVHFMRSDLLYADMYGNDPQPSRPAVVYVAGFTAQTRAPFLLQRFTSLGFSPVQVCVLTAPNGATTGALVQLARPDLVSRAIQAVRKRLSNWTIMTFAEYYQSRLQQQQEAEAGTSGSSAGASGAPGRTPPRIIRAGPAQSPLRAAEVAGESGDGPTASASARGQSKAAAAAVTSPDASEARVNQAQSRVAQQQNERQRLQAFTQMAAAAASASGMLPSRSGSRDESEGGASGSDAEASSSLVLAAEAAASGASVSGSALEAGTAQQLPGAVGSEIASPAGTPSSTHPGANSESAAGSQSPESRTDSEASAEDAEAARRVAERLRSLALAAQRLKGLPAKDRPGGGGAEGGSGGGMTLQRPGRPAR